MNQSSKRSPHPKPLLLGKLKDSTRGAAALVTGLQGALHHTDEAEPTQAILILSYIQDAAGLQSKVAYLESLYAQKVNGAGTGRVRLADLDTTQKHDARMEEVRQLLGVMETPWRFQNLITSAVMSVRQGIKEFDAAQELMPEASEVSGLLSTTGYHDELEAAMSEVSRGLSTFQDLLETLERTAGALRAVLQQKDAAGGPVDPANPPVTDAPPAGNSTPARRTQEEIDNLVANWKADPNWDLETTEGFEAHHQELLSVRLEQDEAWKAEREREYAKKAEELGVPGNLALARHFINLEFRLNGLITNS